MARDVVVATDCDVGRSSPRPLDGNPSFAPASKKWLGHPHHAGLNQQLHCRLPRHGRMTWSNFKGLKMDWANGEGGACQLFPVPIGADKLIKHAQKVPNGIVTKSLDGVAKGAEAVGKQFQKIGAHTDDVLAHSKIAKEAGESTAEKMAARSCGGPGNWFVAGTLGLVARGPAEVRLLTDVGASVSPGEPSADGAWVTPLLAAGALRLWLSDRPARRRQRRFVCGRKSIGRRPRAREVFLETEDDHVSPRSPQRRSRRLHRGVSATRRTETAVATVAALRSAAVLCEPGLPATSRVSRAWGLVWNLMESSRVSASVVVTTWPRGG